MNQTHQCEIWHFCARFVRVQSFVLQQPPLLHLLTGVSANSPLFARLQVGRIWLPDGATTPTPASSRSSARTAEPPGMDVKGGPSAFLSLTSKLAVPVPAGVGTILMVDVSLVFICHAACLCRLARKAAQRKAAQSYWLSDLSVCFGCGSL